MIDNIMNEYTYVFLTDIVYWIKIYPTQKDTWL